MRFFSRNFLARSRCLLTSAIPAVCLLGARGPAIAGGALASLPKLYTAEKARAKIQPPGDAESYTPLAPLLCSVAAKRFELIGRRSPGNGRLGQRRAFAERTGNTGSHQGRGSIDDDDIAASLFFRAFRRSLEQRPHKGRILGHAAAAQRL